MTQDRTKDRKSFLGGSDIAAVMGLSRWKTPLSLWAEKTGKIQNELSNFEAAEIGTELEEYVCRKFTKKTGIALRVDNRMFTHKKYNYMVAHIDRWVTKGDAVFEAKTASAWKEKEWGGEDIPIEYTLQLIWYLGIVGKKTGYIAVLIGGQKFIHKEIQFDQELFDKQVEAARIFWEDFVLTDTAPMAMEGDSATLLGLFPQSQPPTLKLEGDKALLLDELCDSRAGGIESIKHAEEELDKIEVQIKQLLGEAEGAETENYTATWKSQIRTSADIEKMKAEGIFEKYCKTTSSRSLRTKARGSK